MMTAPDRSPHYALPGHTVERDFAMSNELLDTLESKLLAAVNTIESQRREIDELKVERRSMEEKLRGLIGRIDQAGGESPQAPETSPDLAPQRAAEPAVDSRDNSFNPYRQPDADF